MTPLLLQKYYAIHKELQLPKNVSRKEHYLNVLQKNTFPIRLQHELITIEILFFLGKKRTINL